MSSPSSSGFPVCSTVCLEPRGNDGIDPTVAAERKAREARADAIEAALVNQYMREALGRHVLGLLLASTMAVMCWPNGRAEFVLLWFCVVLGGTFARRHLAQRFLGVVEAGGKPARDAFLQRSVPFYALMGAAWGSTPLLFIGRGGVAEFACWAILAALIYSATPRLALLPRLRQAFMWSFYAVLVLGLGYLARLDGEGVASLWFMPVAIAQYAFTQRLSRDARNTQSALHGAQYDLARKSEEAVAAVAAKNKFLAAATHDMRQPVIAMGLYAEFLEADPDSYDELAPKIGRAAQVVNKLFDSLFDLSAFDAGQVRLSIEPVSVASVVLALHEEYEPLAEARGLTLRVHLRDAIVQSDEVRLRRMIGNVLSNAIKYTHPGGKILLAVRPAGDTVRVEVWDQGIGIPADQIDKVCQEFYRAEGGSQLAPDGLGIGLALVTRLADALRARVKIDSVEGKGTRVSFTLADVETDPARRVRLPASCG